MWTKENRKRYERKGLRYESDLTDEEFALIEPFLPPERSVSRRSLVNGILYLLTTGCQWRQLPKDFPPRARRTTTMLSLCAPAPSREFIMRSMPRYVRWKAGPQHQPWRSWIVKP